MASRRKLQQYLRQMATMIPIIVILSSVFLGCGAARSSESSTSNTTDERPELAQDVYGFTLPIELIDNRIFFDVHLGEESPPFRFVLDSGAHTVIDLSVARQLGLEEEDANAERSAEPAESAPFRVWLNNLVIGEARFRELLVTVMALTEVRDGIGFERLDGIIGLETLQQYVVTIDYTGQRLIFVEASRFNAQTMESATVIPFDYQNHVPIVDGIIEGQETRLRIDIGDRSALTLTIPFIEDNGFRQGPRVSAERITGWTIGGPVRTQMTRIESLSIGDLHFENIDTRLPSGQTGVSIHDSVGGSVGNGLLKTRNLTIDFRGRRLIFGPGGLPVTHRDRAGLWFQRQESRVVVADVVPESPAARAGIREGETLIAALDQRTPSINIIALRDTLASPETAEIELTLRSPEGEERTVTLRLTE